jgi:hypothetical protein
MRTAGSTQGQNRPQDPNVGAERTRMRSYFLAPAAAAAGAGAPLCRFWTSSALW